MYTYLNSGIATRVQNLTSLDTGNFRHVQLGIDASSVWCSVGETRRLSWNSCSRVSRVIYLQQILYDRGIFCMLCCVA